MLYYYRCYHCNLCKSDYDVCLDCVAETRGCIHNAQLKLMEYLSRKQLIISLAAAMRSYERLCEHYGVSPEPIPVRLNMAGRVIDINLLYFAEIPILPQSIGSNTRIQFCPSQYSRKCI